MSAQVGRRAFLGGAAAALALPGARAAVVSASPDLLHVRAASDIGILDPAHHSGYLEEEVIRCLFVTLNHIDDFRRGIGTTPGAAEELVWLDPLSLRFRLREGLDWTEGHGPVTAEDVKFSFERIADPRTGSPWVSYFDSLREVELVDARTGILRFSEPRPSFPLCSLPWYGGHVVCRAAVEGLKAGGDPIPHVTCGPYRVERWRPNQDISLVANAGWRGPPPDFERVLVSVIPDEEVAALAYQAGSVDFTRVSVNTLEVMRRRPPPATTLIGESGNSLIWLTLNIDHPKLRDARVREAVQRAIGLSDIIEGAYGGVARPATGVIPPGMIGHRPACLIPDGDPAAARRLLDSAGAAGLGLTLSVLNGTVTMTVAQIIQAHLRSAGVDVSIKAYDAGTYWTLGDESLGNSWRDLQLVLMDFAGGVDPSDNTLWFLSSQVGRLNWSRFADPEYDRLNHQALIETDPARRGAMYRRMQDLMELSGGFKFLTHGIYAAAHGAAISPTVLPDGYVDIPRFRKVAPPAY